MADDIGPGDVVERIDAGDIWVAGDRTIVVAVQPPRPSSKNECRVCGERPEIGLVLINTYNPRITWCPNHWRKIGGSQADTIRRFAEDLTSKPAADAPTRETVDG